MKFSLISDMHLDFPQQKTPYDKLESLVIVAGDSANGLVGVKFLNKLKRKGHKEFAVDGNHEHYANISQGRTAQETQTKFFEGIEQENFKQLSDGLAIVGYNGWYLVRRGADWQSYMNDSLYSGLSKAQVNSLAEEHSYQIEEKLIHFEGKLIVVTHTAPCMETLDPKYVGHHSNEWYWNPYMRPLLSKYSHKIAVWCHGHTHARTDKMVDGVRVVCNPRGYPRENPEWEPMTVEI